MKKYLLSLLCLFCLSITLTSQNSPEQSMGQIKTKAKEHFDKIKKEKGTLKGYGYNEYKRLEWFWSDRLRDDEKLSKAGDAFRKHLETRNRNIANNLNVRSNNSYSCSSNAVWQELGPNTTANLSNYQGGIGVTNFITFHPQYNGGTNQTIFAGGLSGLWKSINDGQSWTNLNTDNLDVSTCSSLAIDHSNTNIMYLASGHGGSFALAGDVFSSPYRSSIGVYKSVNGGNTWSKIGPTINEWGQGWVNKRISNIKIHPTNSNVVYITSYFYSWTGGGHWESKIYKTIDGGTTWHEVFYANNSYIMDMEFMPTNPNIIYISGHRFFRLSDTPTNTSTLASTDLTANLSGWVLPNPIPEGVGHLYNLQIAVTPAASNKICIAGINEVTGLRRIWISTNQGNSFIVRDLTNLPNCGYNCEVGLAPFKICFDISPTNANRMYLAGTGINRSDDDGVTFLALNDAWQGPLHPDHRYIKCAPNSDTKIFSCNDAGIFMSNSMGNINTWVHRSTGLGISWVYRLGLSTTLNSNSVDKISIGLQDVTSMIKSTTGWFQPNVFGDGMESVVDYTNANIMYRESQNGDIERSTDGQNFSWEDTGPSGAGNSDWVTPYQLDPNNHNRVFVGRKQLWSRDFGITNSQPVELNNPNAPPPNDGNFIISMAVAPSNSNIIYVGYREGVLVQGTSGTTIRWNRQLFRTQNGGQTWQDITPTGTLAEGLRHSITAILVHPNNPNKIWISYSNYYDETGTYTPKKVFYSENGGLLSNNQSTWKNFSDGLENMPTNTLILNNNRLDDEELYIGTDIGVYFRNKYMHIWECYGNHMPNIPISEIEINPNLKLLRAATVGRGVWETGTYCPADQTLTLPTSPKGFYAATSSIISSSTIAATETVNNVSRPRIVAYRSPVITLQSGFTVELGATFNTGSYSCTPFTANLTNNNTTGPSTDNIKQESNVITSEETYLQITPNPFSDNVKLSFQLTTNGLIDIMIYDIQGKVVQNVVNNKFFNEGKHEFLINTSQWQNGLYICKTIINQKAATYKFNKQK